MSRLRIRDRVATVALATVTCAAIAAPTLAVDELIDTLAASTEVISTDQTASSRGEGRHTGPFDPSGVVVQPGQPFGQGGGGNACTTGFLAGDEAYLQGRAHGRRYLLVAGHCLIHEYYNEDEGDVIVREPGTGEAVYLYDRNFYSSALEDVPVNGLTRIGETAWVDRTVLWQYVGSESPIAVDATADFGAVRLDADVSVDPVVPALGVPIGFATSVATLIEAGADADWLHLYGRSPLLGEIAGTPAAAHRQGPAVSRPAPSAVCVAIPVSIGDSGSPVMTDGGRAVGVVSDIDAAGASWATDQVDEPCDGTRVTMLTSLLDAFERDTGVRLQLLTKQAGPILR